MVAVTLGKVYKDRVSGFLGTATCRLEYLNGCVQVLLVGKKLGTDAKPVEVYFDVQQLEEVPAKRTEVKRRRTGGPTPSAVHHMTHPKK